MKDGSEQPADVRFLRRTAAIESVEIVESVEVAEVGVEVVRRGGVFVRLSAPVRL
jgi:hypothetical protein